MSRIKIIKILGIVSLSALLFFGIIVGIFIGINMDEKEKLKSYIADLSIDEEKYTPYTYNIYLKEYDEAQKIAKRLFVTPQAVEEQYQELKQSVDTLCKRADKDSLIALYEECDALNIAPYTTKTVSAFLSVYNEANRLIEDPNALEAEVEDTFSRLEKARNELKIATVGIYEVVAVRKQITNNHVGSSWTFFMYHKGEKIKSGYTFQAALNSTTEFIVQMKDNDSVPDSGTSFITTALIDGLTRKTQISVTEHRGQYAGNRAIWEVELQIKLVGKLSSEEAKAGLSFEYFVYPVVKPEAEIHLHTNCSILDTEVVLNDGAQSQLPYLEREGYAFGGWYKEPDFLTPVGNASLAGVCDLYARWIALSDMRISIDEAKTTTVGTEETQDFFFVPKTGKMAFAFRVSHYFVAVDVKIENVTQGKILYESLTFGARDYSIEFNANAGDEIRMTLEGFDVAEFHGYDFSYTLSLMSEFEPTIYTVKAYSTQSECVVTYLKHYHIEPLFIEGYNFIGFYTNEGVQLTDENGDSLEVYNNLGDLYVYAKYEKVIED